MDITIPKIKVSHLIAVWIKGISLCLTVYVWDSMVAFFDFRVLSHWLSILLWSTTCIIPYVTILYLVLIIVSFALAIESFDLCFYVLWTFGFQLPLLMFYCFNLYFVFSFEFILIGWFIINNFSTKKSRVRDFN